MPCVQIIEDGIAIGFVCGSGCEDIHLNKCTECGNNWPEAEFLCDYPVGDDKTCDRVLCKSCSKLVGRDMHYCPTHWGEYQEYKSSEKGNEKILESIAAGKILPVVK
jgi:hypothetical protein